MFVLFAGRIYYPYGGWDDMIGIFDTFESAQERHQKGYWFDGQTEADARPYQWAHIVDLSTFTVTKLKRS